MGLFSRRETGQHYEQLAADYLSRQGLRLLDKNFHSRSGELDLIMQDGPCLVFIEVKYRKNQNHGHAAEAVTFHKQARLIKTANWWMLKRGYHAESADFRFDVIAIHQHGQHIEWIKNAITQG
ncbi:YraN family protein [Vibrio cincinnatiensis]|jgi:putative endonuclease|uniref:UPF0102 protein SAMN02745782_01162 n=1 Tax=Vibrio cincinnatiensis DSM 19608 TaxID=1123491 RepID=A0A1T4N0A0_VIBCI|nr:YraN family protein [Vibrio cincinnatiensis]MCG3721234.1 YraN family protein [Vibrio cincinnatiensis]MCG3725959.1 YraN family protein [Vibrio cincinnatiensis]MCG3733318.1 YraN family protein [Vibrio cincinnatiensis]MCG3735260.1 YraN family protein [Vibrio cincinnatiensis]MCG3740605.1 YraN family protein [Vibrio cincinnatiensis]